MEENIALKESIAKSQQSANQLHEMLTMTTDEHTRVKKQRDDLKHKLHELTEKFKSDKLKWDNEVIDLKRQKAKLSENSGIH